MLIYEENLIQEATANGALAEQDADNEYTRENGIKQKYFNAVYDR